MKQNITLLDGALGTALWAKAEAHGWEKEPVWIYNLEHPEIVSEIAREYADAGSEIILANTFGANGPSVARSSSYAAFVIRRCIDSSARSRSCFRRSSSTFCIATIESPCGLRSTNSL